MKESSGQPTKVAFLMSLAKVLLILVGDEFKPLIAFRIKINITILSQ